MHAQKRSVNDSDQSIPFYQSSKLAGHACMLTALVFLASSAANKSRSREDEWMPVWWGIPIEKKHAAGALFLPIPSVRAFAACQRFAACAGFESLLPNIPLPTLPLFTRHTTDHSFSLPERKRPGYAPSYMLRRFSHYRITPWLPLFLVERHAAAAVYVTWDVLGFACCCRFLSSRQSAFAIE